MSFETDIEIQGWLNIKGVSSDYVRKYCQFQNSQLSCYESDESRDEENTYKLTQNTTIHLDSDQEITLSNPSLTLQADSKESANDWINNLKTSVSFCQQISMDDFKILSVLGRGSFGKVMLVERKKNGKLYAIKSIRKKKLIDSKRVDLILTERNILAKIRHPFIIRLHFAFQSQTKFYIGLEYAAGGELSYHLEDDEHEIPISDIRIYLGEIALALDYLHQHGIIYRDLKPENVMLDSEGHIKLTDFGLSKEANEADSFCGTSEYVAPEVVLKHQYGVEVDWWSLGILAYELITFTTPFYNKNKTKMLNDIVSAIPKMDKIDDKSLSNLIHDLLNKDPKHRPKLQEIKVHPFFDGFDWDKLYRKEIRPSFAPEINDPREPKYFDQQFTSEMPVDSYARDTVITPFENFSFCEDFAISDSIS